MTPLPAGHLSADASLIPQTDLSNETTKGAQRAPFVRCGCGSRYLILASRNSTCFFATGSYFFITSLSVMVREFFLVT